MQVVIDASPSGVTKERSQSYQRPLQAKRVQTIAQTTAPTPKRPNRATSAPRAFPSIFHPRISQDGVQEDSDNMAKSGLGGATSPQRHTAPCDGASPVVSSATASARLIGRARASALAGWRSTARSPRGRRPSTARRPGLRGRTRGSGPRSSRRSCWRARRGASRSPCSCNSTCEMSVRGSRSPCLDAGSGAVRGQPEI